MITIDRLKAFIEAAYPGHGGQTKFAEAVGLTPQSLSRYLKGDRLPGADMLERWATTGLNIHWLLTGEGSMMHTGSDKLTTVILASLERIDAETELIRKTMAATGAETAITEPHARAERIDSESSHILKDALRRAATAPPAETRQEQGARKK